MFRWICPQLLRGHPGLAQRQPGVAASLVGRSKHPHAGGLQAHDQAFAQDAVEKTAAAQAHGVTVVCIRCADDPGGERNGKREVEAGRGCVHIGGVCVEQRRQKAAQVEPVVIVDQRTRQGRVVRVLLQPACGRRLQRNGRFGFFALAQAQVQGAGRSIEPAAGAAGVRAVEPTLEHLHHAAGQGLAHGGSETWCDLGAPAKSMQGACCHAPGLAGSAITAGQGELVEVPESLPPGAMQPQQFAAPGTAIRAQTHAVEGQSDHRLVKTVFGQHGRDVCLVVLHAKGRHTEQRGLFDGEAGAEEIGVQIVRNGLHRPTGGLGLPQQRLHRVFQRLAGVRIAKIAMHG